MWLTTRDIFNPVFDNFWNDRDEKQLETFSPAANVVEKKDNYELDVFLPGMKKEDINIEVKEKTLTISGERKKETKETKDGYEHYEAAFGKFTRTWNIEGVDTNKIEADYKDGVLKVSLPKHADEKPKKIALK